MSLDKAKIDENSHDTNDDHATSTAAKYHSATSINDEPAVINLAMLFLSVVFFPLFVLFLLNGFLYLLVMLFWLAAWLEHVYETLQAVFLFLQSLDWSSPVPWMFFITWAMCSGKVWLYLRRRLPGLRLKYDLMLEALDEALEA